MTKKPCLLRGVLLTGLFLLIFPTVVLSDPPVERPHVSPKWDFDSNWPTDSVRSPVQAAAEQINDILIKQTNAWNRHDLDDYLAGYWNSPQLLYASEGQVVVGWQRLHDNYKVGFRDTEDMGIAQTERIRIRMIRPDLALALQSWAITFPKTVNTIVGVDTDLFLKLDGAWKIISVHSCTMDM